MNSQELHRVPVHDTLTGRMYPSQCSMLRAVFPNEYKTNHFYMYKAYQLFPDRFIRAPLGFTGKSVRAYAQAEVSLPRGWNSENTSIVFRVTVRREDKLRYLPQRNIEVKVRDTQEYDD